MNTDAMKLELYKTHEDLGAKLVPFAGYMMPLHYGSIGEEHKAVRERAGLFDVSHMGEFIIKGKEAMELVQHISSNDVRKLEIGEAQYSCMPWPNGGIVDDLIIYRLGEDRCAEGERAYMLVVNAANIEKDREWILKHKDHEAELEDISEASSLLALQGPNAVDILAELTDLSVRDILYYTFEKGSVAGVGNVLVSATGYTGSGGFELYLKNEDVVTLWQALMETGKKYGLQACGLGARDTLRLEMGYCLYGNDIDDETNTIEAGLSWITKFTVEDFIGKDFLQKVKKEKPARRLVGLKMQGRRVPRKGYDVLNSEGEVIGEITSGTMSPSLEMPIALAYVSRKYRKSGTELMVQFGKKQMPGVVEKLPFYKK